jgi:multiple sugar transport system permease protein
VTPNGPTQFEAQPAEPAPSRAIRPDRRIAFGVISSIGLLLLLIVNLVPVLLVVRQAFTPESLSAGWPLPLLPERMDTENLTTLWQAQSLAPSLLRSLWVAGTTTALSIAIGFPAGWAAARFRPLEAGLTRLSLASRLLPPIAIAVPLTVLLNRVFLYDHPMAFGLIVAHLAVGLPFAVLFSYAAFRDVPEALEEAASVDGCNPLQTFFYVSLPAVKGSIAAASILIFLLSWDELTYALLIQVLYRTVPPLIYYYTQFGQLGAASILAVIMLIPAILVIAVLQRLLTRAALTGGVKE